jgi:hypothetical protein
LLRFKPETTLALSFGAHAVISDDSSHV